MRLESWKGLIHGNNIFQKSYEDENFDRDIALEAIDHINQACKLTFEIDTEVEAVCLAYLGKIYYKGFKNTEKAKKNYRDCVRLLETLKPRIFNQFKWHQLMTKHMIEITEEEQRKEQEEQNKLEEKFKEEAKEELEDLNKYKDEGYVPFLKHISEKYQSYQKTKVEFTEEMLNSANLKRTIIRTCVHYHSDKSAKAKEDGFTEKDIYLRNVITKTLTQFINQLKG